MKTDLGPMSLCWTSVSVSEWNSKHTVGYNPVNVVLVLQEPPMSLLHVSGER